MGESAKTHYQILGVPPAALHEEIAARYRDLARLHHPDAGGDGCLFAKLAEAWAVIGDKALRKAYDKELRFTRTPCSRCAGTGVTYVHMSYNQGQKTSCKTCGGVGFAPAIKREGI